jgi:hypothetical protein
MTSATSGGFDRGRLVSRVRLCGRRTASRDAYGSGITASSRRPLWLTGYSDSCWRVVEGALATKTEVGVLAPDRAVEPRLLIELLRPVVATAARDIFT